MSDDLVSIVETVPADFTKWSYADQQAWVREHPNAPSLANPNIPIWAFYYADVPPVGAIVSNPPNLKNIPAFVDVPPEGFETPAPYYGIGTPPAGTTEDSYYGTNLPVDQGGQGVRVVGIDPGTGLKIIEPPQSVVYHPGDTTIEVAKPGINVPEKGKIPWWVIIGGGLAYFLLFI